MLLGIVAFLIVVGGCAGGGGGGIIVPSSPTPTGGATPTPAPCGTSAPGSLFIAMASYITATTSPTYGLINGYAIVATDGTYSNVAEPLMVRPGDILQFVNVEPVPNPSQAPIQHSAVSLLGSTFPPLPSFPPTAQAPIGSTITTNLWSTGRVPVLDDGTLCYSQTLTAHVAGTYAIGDYDYYTLTNTRDVLIVSATAPQSRARAGVFSRPPIRQR
jgi:hypothetical protein